MKGGRRGRPKAEHQKEAVKIRLDADLRSTGDGWQTRINETLRLAGRV